MPSIPNIPAVFDKFPDNYINDINGWSFDKQTIYDNKGKLLTLDIDFGSYCSLNCPLCFRKKNSIDNNGKEIGIDNLKSIIVEGKNLGLRSVKFLGKGEPFENDGFLELLWFLNELDIIPLIFTKGHVIGNDDLVERYFHKYDINTGELLVKELKRLNVSIMLGFNSFDKSIQTKMVGGDNSYIKHRNKALKILVNEGFNSTNPTKLALAINPITKWNIKEAFNIYRWGRIRNMYCIVTPTMISGRAKDKTWHNINPKESELIELYIKIYKFNVEKNIQTKNQILQEGVSSYAGGHPCNQVSCGLYVTLNGCVLSCPGSEFNIEGDIHKNSLTDIWDNSNNNKLRSGIFNTNCIAKDGKSIPLNLYNEIYKRL